MPQKKTLKAGDMFCSAFPGAKLGFLIKAAEKIMSKDFHADMSHSGLILNSKGDTWEILWRLKTQNFFEAYEGCNVLVVRYKKLKDVKHFKAIKDLSKHDGQIYPVHRFLLYLTGLARFVHWSRLVCSEFVAKYLYYINARHKHYWGTTPDILSEEFRNYKIYRIIFDGILKPEEWVILA